MCATKVRLPHEERAVANSLQDQLRKSGLVSAQKARQANAEKRKKNKRKRAGGTDEDAARKVELARAAAEKVERDRALNREQQARAEARAVQAQIQQLIDMNIVDRGDEATTFSYTLDGTVKTLHVSEGVRKALALGSVALVSQAETVAIVPAGVARKILARDEERVVLLNDSEDVADDVGNEDDPYAEFKVPDDLMW